MEEEEEEEEISHFSHEHPLIPLKEHPSTSEEQTDDGETESMSICYGCNQPVLLENEAYRCPKKYCETVFLHKVCAQLPREINHPSHQEHSLILLATSPYFRNLGDCDVCGADLDGFNYYCSLCDFNVDVKCAIKEKEALFDYVEAKFKHPNHQHLLVYQPRPAAFRCSACQVEDRDLSYQCDEYGCPFWIHKRCAFLPTTAEMKDHSHPLSLIYELPSDYLTFIFYCSVCGGMIHKMQWAYLCRMCRYFVHIKCMEAQKVRTGDDYLYNDDDDTFEERLLKVLLPVDFLQLPVDDVSVDLFQRFLLRKNCLTNIQPIINPFTHPHPLILSSGNTQEEDGEEIICDACVSPITTSQYYSCVECQFFLHVPCTKLPNELQHPSHPHPLTLGKYIKFYNGFKCSVCRFYSNGYFYECASCKFRVDIKCASLQTMISHETHDHPLFQTTPDSRKPCFGCGFNGEMPLFGCEPCNFNLHLNCMMLPKRVGHRFDYHDTLELSFPPYPDHPEPFDCLECEEEAHPNLWLYRCKECDLHFHIYCAGLLFGNVKFGRNLKISTHRHPVKFVPKASVKSPCHDCGADLHEKKYLVFECETCNFHLCRPCVERIDA